LLEKNKGDFNMAIDAIKMANDCSKAWNSHDVNKIFDFYTEDCVYEDLGLGVVKHGKKEFTDYINTMFADFPDIKWEVKSAFGTNDWQGNEWIMSGTHAHSTMTKNAIPATGKTFSIRVAGIYQLRNGKYSRESVYYNMATFLQQVGLMPGQPK
jgi:steroid delta-isomerase-like uncharacterized protein